MGVKHAKLHHRHPHPNLPPSRGKEFMLRIFSRSCYIQPKLYLKYPNAYPSQPVEGEGTFTHPLPLWIPACAGMTNCEERGKGFLHISQIAGSCTRFMIL